MLMSDGTTAFLDSSLLGQVGASLANPAPSKNYALPLLCYALTYKTFSSSITSCIQCYSMAGVGLVATPVENTLAGLGQGPSYVARGRAWRH